MKAQRTYFETLAAGKGRSLNVVVACDSFQTGTTAMEIYESFIEHFGDDFLFQRHLFDFHNIADAHTTERAFHRAILADVIIVAFAGKEFPDFIQEWLSALSLVREKRPGVLIGLLPYNATAEICEVLESTARIAEIEFLRINLSCPVFSEGRPRCSWCFPWAGTKQSAKAGSSS